MTFLRIRNRIDKLQQNNFFLYIHNSDIRHKNCDYQLHNNSNLRIQIDMY